MCAAPMDQHKLRAFTDIITATRTISDQILSKYMFKSLPTASHVFLFRKQFAAQAALTSLFSYLFSCMASTPHRFVFVRASGAVYLQDLAVHYNQEMKQRNADMPYRMTRNMSCFISQYGIEGWFLVTQALAAQAMTGTKQNLKWALHLFFRYGLRRPRHGVCVQVLALTASGDLSDLVWRKGCLSKLSRAVYGPGCLVDS